MTDSYLSADTAGRLAFVVGRINRKLQSATGGLSHALLSTLATVTKAGPVRLADLAQIENVSAPTMTRVVAQLQERGLVERSDDPNDGRVTFIAVTPAGTSAIVDARAARAAVVTQLLAALGPDDADAIHAALPALERMLAQS